ncbi:hypothetical protein ABEB36_009073 [Hypothenemus hampei]|uniref:Ionotropic receptor n=1 Tax=Hypothenemus hampei TaxID=57062 RepID=A0ABD1EP10_HYPHA
MTVVLFLVVLLSLQAQTITNAVLNDYLKYIECFSKFQSQRNFVIFSKSELIEDFLYSFHKVAPIVFIDLEKHRNDENFNKTQMYFRSYVRNAGNLNFLFLNNIEEIYEAYAKVTDLYFWKSRHNYIIVCNFTMDQVKIYHENLFKNHWITNIAFTNYSFSETVRYNPFSKELFKDKNPANIIFRPILNDLYGYPLRVAMFSHLIAKWTGKEFIGRDGFLVSVILQKLNASVKYILTPPGDYGILLENGTALGTIKLIKDGDADANFNTRYLFIPASKSIEFTYPNDYDNVIIALPIHYVGFRKIGEIIPGSYFGLYVLLFAAFSVYAKFNDNLTNSRLFVIFIQILSGQATKVFNSKFYRILIISLIFYYSFVINIFQAKLTSVLTIPSTLPYLTTTQEVMDSNYTIISPIDALGNPLRIIEDVKSLETIISRINFLHGTLFYKKIKKCSDNVGFVTAKKLYRYYIEKIRDEHNNMIKCYYPLEQTLRPVYMSFIVKHGLPLLENINKIIQRTVETGLQNIWENNHTKIFPIRYITSTKKIGFENFKDYFISGFFGITLSFFVCLIEIFVGKIQNHNKNC